jgi:hypothetical protein
LQLYVPVSSFKRVMLRWLVMLNWLHIIWT